MELCVLAADIPANDAALLLFPAGELKRFGADGGALVNGSEERCCALTQQVTAGCFIDETGDTFAGGVGQVKLAVF